MTRIFPGYTYGSGPRAGCWWDTTCQIPDQPSLDAARSVDVAVIGAGFTGVSAALHLARFGVETIVLEAEFTGWGASGRNGGFCCLGGGMLGDAQLDARFGKPERLEFRAAEKAAVALVARLIAELDLDVDRHSAGETELAHRPKDMAALRRKAETTEENYGVSAQLIDQADLPAQGLTGPFFGALTVPVGFGLNPLKYLTGVARAAEDAGARIFHYTPVRALAADGGRYRITCDTGTVTAKNVVIATNGYSSEHLPPWLSGRYMPGQSNVLVTRPLTQAEIDAQGWSSDQMCYDTRHLLHYFRLMPDRRFLFGMRGGLLSSPAADQRARKRILRDFANLFPAWAEVEPEHIWSGLVCLARNRLPFVGELPDMPGLWAGLCYHGNGIAMGTLSGKIIAERIAEREPDIHPRVLRSPLAQFPFGRARRVIMPPVYAGLALSDLI